MDGLMMDRLYGELAPDQQRSFDDHRAACARCAGELAGFERTRAAYRELSVAEPPAALAAILLHEAARRGPAEQGALAALGAWFQRVVAPIGAHPAAAAMASLVLVAGIAGTLYVRGEAEVARPVSRAAGAPAAPAPATPPATGAAGAPAAEPAPTMPEVAAETAPPSTVATSPGALEEKSVEPTRPRAAKEDAELDADGAGPFRVAAKQGYAADLLDEQRADELKSASGSGSGRGRGGELEPRAKTKKVATADRERDDTSYASPPPPPAGRSVARRAAEQGPIGGVLANPVASPAPATAGTEPADDDAPAADAAAKPQPKPKDDRAAADQGWLDGKSAALRAAVKQRRCVEVATIANDVLDRDPAYYAARLARSKELAACATLISKEQGRRRAARSRTRETRGKAAAPAEAVDAEGEAAPSKR